MDIIKKIKKWWDGEDVWETRFKLEPLEDITAYELALLMNVRFAPLGVIDELPICAKRHLVKYKVCYRNEKWIKEIRADLWAT